MTIILKAGDTVRAAAWADTAFATVDTIEEFQAKTPYYKSAEEAIERAIRAGHPLAWASYAGSMLVGDRRLGQQLLAQKRAAVARAATLHADDEVEIEGRLYTVTFPQKQDAREYPSLSDPIHFVPAAR